MNVTLQILSFVQTIIFAVGANGFLYIVIKTFIWNYFQPRSTSRWSETYCLVVSITHSLEAQLQYSTVFWANWSINFDTGKIMNLCINSVHVNKNAFHEFW
jgi:hypothetical protein